MTKIYLIRHAEAEGNIYRRAHGQYNGLITPKGQRQISLLHQRFMDIQIDAVYSSDLTRAVQTAQAVAKPRKLDIYKAQELREVHLGAWEDTTWGEIEYSDGENNILFNKDPARWKTPGSETYDSVYNRVYGFVRDAAIKHSGGTIAVFTHGFAIRTFISRIRGVPSHKTQDVPYCDNTAVTLLTFDNDMFTIDYAGDNSHLGRSGSTLENQSWWRAVDKQKPENLRFLSLTDIAPETLFKSFMAKAGERAQTDTHYAGLLVNEIVGILGLDMHRDAANGIGWVNYVYVISHHRKNTFGTQLLGQAISDFRKQHRSRLRIEMSPGSPGAAFLLRCGFSALPGSGDMCMFELDIRNW